MDVASLLLDLYGRLPPLARAAVDGADADALTTARSPAANTIAWLVCHPARGQDHHAAEVRDAAQVWTSGDWARRVGLEPDPSNTGYGHGPADVARVRPEDGAALLDYLDA